MLSEEDQYIKFRRKVELELTKVYRVRVILKTVVKYYGISRKLVVSDSTLAPLVYIRHMIIYICCSIYGIDQPKVAKFLRYKTRGGFGRILDKMADEMRTNSRVNRELEEIRAILNKCLKQ